MKRPILAAFFPLCALSLIATIWSARQFKDDCNRTDDNDAVA